MTVLKWGREFIVNSPKTTSQRTPVVTALDDGGFAIAWRDDGVADDLVRWRRYDALGASVGGEHLVAGTGNQTSPDLVQLEDGDLWIVQTDNDGATSDIAGQVISLDGTSIRMQEPSSGLLHSLASPAIASLGNQGSVAVYADQGLNAGDISIRYFNASGAPGTAFTVNTRGSSLAGVQRDPAIAVSPDHTKILVAWTDTVAGTAIQGRILGSNGSEQVGEFTLISNNGSGLEKAKVVWLDDNKFVVVHDGVLDGNNKGIGFEIIDSAGAELANGQVNIVTSGAQHSVDVAALPNGGFAVVWVDPSGTGLDTSGTAIKLQVFDGLGSMRGVETLVNTVKGLDQVEPSIEALSDGRLIVSWRDNSSSKAVPNSAVIRAQIIDPREGQVIGNDLVNTLYGHDTQPDNIEGRGADDVLSGLGGADEIHGGAGDDMLIGGIGGDLLDGGDDSDTADYRLSGKGQVAISLLADTASGGDAEGDALDGIENLFGSLTLRDILIGDDGGNRISGFGGIDSIRGEGGNDNLEGGAGGDSLNGGAGIGDTAIYRNSNLGIVNVNLLLGTASGGEADSDSLFFIENLDGSATQRDILIGSDVANVLSGNGGNDSIRGEGGADTISGEAGADGLNGGSGTDTVDYTNSDAGVAVDLNVATQASGGHANGDTLFFFENIFGSRFGDTLRGTMTANRLSGSNGSDTLNGREGSDYLTGGTEADTFRFDVTALGVDTIVDWQDGLDKISIGALVETSYAGLAIEAQGTTRVIIRGLNGTGAIAVESASAFTLDAGDFMFV